MIQFIQKDYSEISEEANKIGELNIFQTIDWINYISVIQNATPIILAIYSDEVLEGFFSGLIIKKYGLKILGSPFRGWQTYFMGFNLKADAPKTKILESLHQYAIKELGCNYIEIIDPNLSEEDWKNLSYNVEYLNYYGIDLTRSEEDLYASMDKKSRNCIRKSIKNGVVIEESIDKSFAEDYYAQYKEVLSRHSLVPLYSLDSLKKMIEIFLPTGNLLLLRSRDPGGKCIATGIFISLNNTAIFWGAASWREFQFLRPNESLAWYAMKKLKSRGIKTFHFGGKAERYKEKLGCVKLPLFRLMRAKSPIIGIPINYILSFTNEKYRNWMQRLFK